MAKVSIQLSESEKRKSGEAPLYLVCRHRDARAKLSLGMTVKPKDWNDRTGEVHKTHPHHRRLHRSVLVPGGVADPVDLRALRRRSRRDGLTVYERRAIRI